MLKTRWFVNRQIGVLSSLNYYKSQTPEDGKVVLRTNWLEVVQQPAPSSTVLYRFSSQFKIPKIPACLSTWEWKGWQMEFGLVHHYFERRNVMAGCINGSEWINFGYPIRYMRCGSSSYPKVLKSRYSDHLNLRRRKVFTIRSSINHLKIRDRIQCILAAWLHHRRFRFAFSWKCSLHHRKSLSGWLEQKLFQISVHFGSNGMNTSSIKMRAWSKLYGLNHHPYCQALLGCCCVCEAIVVLFISFEVFHSSNGCLILPGWILQSGPRLRIEYSKSRKGTG